MAKFRESFKQRSDFLRLKESRALVKARFFIANSAASLDAPRYGIIATKKTFASAVDRNRARRLIREWLRLSDNKLDLTLDYSFVLRADILKATRSDGMKELEKALKELKQ
jgi:ribonuclease P protein component